MSLIKDGGRGKPLAAEGVCVCGGGGGGQNNINGTGHSPFCLSLAFSACSGLVTSKVFKVWYPKPGPAEHRASAYDPVPDAYHTW